MITLLFFAHLREQIGEETLQLEFEGSVAQLKEKIMLLYPELELDAMMTAVNEQFATDYQPIQAGDTVAFIPPISGG